MSEEKREQRGMEDAGRDEAPGGVPDESGSLGGSAGSVEEVAAEQTEPGLGPLARAVAVVTDPVAAMRSVQLRGGWIVPLILVIAASLIYFALAGDETAQLSVDQMEKRMAEMVEEGQISRERADEVIEQQSGSTLKIFMLAGMLVNPFIVALLIAVVALLVGNLVLGGNEKFGKYWSVAWHGYVIAAIATVVTAVLVNVKGDVASVQLGLGILTQGQPESTLHKILTPFQVFNLWQAAVIGVGVSIFARRPLWVGIAWMVGLYLVTGIAASFIGGTFTV